MEDGDLNNPAAGLVAVDRWIQRAKPVIQGAAVCFNRIGAGGHASVFRDA